MPLIPLIATLRLPPRLIQKLVTLRLARHRLPPRHYAAAADAAPATLEACLFTSLPPRRCRYQPIIDAMAMAFAAIFFFHAFSVTRRFRLQMPLAGTYKMPIFRHYCHYSYVTPQLMG